ncbi:MAG: SpoIID/LytB domain-containing protein [Eubacteriales bacterium]
MKKYRNRDERQKRGLRKEWALGLFGLLMATALPALAALLFGLSGGGEAEFLSEQTVVLICRHGGEEADELTLERVLILSLAATNASDTPSASLEAQAVVLRSRAVWWMDYCDGGAEKEQESAKTPVARRTLCDSPAHGLPYCSERELTVALGKDETAARIDAAKRAVTATRGQVLCFEGEVIPAMVHTSSVGVTRSVESLPWLTSVTTPEEAAVTVCRIPAEDARAALAARFGLLLSADPREWEVAVSPNEGTAESVCVGGTILSATVFADALDLPSGNLQIEGTADALIVTCRGAGSGCGLSRAGAEVYARGGLNSGEILSHYYPDCTLGQAWE